MEGNSPTSSTRVRGTASASANFARLLYISVMSVFRTNVDAAANTSAKEERQSDVIVKDGTSTRAPLDLSRLYRVSERDRHGETRTHTYTHAPPHTHTHAHTPK